MERKPKGNKRRITNKPSRLSRSQWRVDFARYAGTQSELESIRRRHNELDNHLSALDKVIR